jgi:ATP-binding cassette, subfamily C, bacterial
MNEPKNHNSPNSDQQISAIPYSISLIKSQPFVIGTIAGFMVVAGLLDGLILSLIALLVELLASGGTPSEDSSVSWAVGIVEFFGISATIFSTIVLALSVMLIRALAIYSHYWLIGRERGKHEASIKRELVSAALTASWTYLLSRRDGDLLNTISVEARRAGNAFQSMLLATAAALNVATYLVVAIFVMWQATLLAVIPVGLTLLFFRFASNRAHKLGRGTTNFNSELTSNINETLGSAKYIKGSALEMSATRRMEPAITALAEIDGKTGKNNGIVQAGYEFIVLAMLLVGLGVTSQFVDLKTGTITLFILLFLRAYQRARGWQQSFQTLNHHMPSVDKVNEILETASSAREISRDSRADKLSESLKLDDVVFRYGDGRKVLDGLSINMPIGSMTSIVGPSGAGKTTIIDVVMGLLVPTSGNVLIDGVSLSTLDPYSWRRQIGYVTQDVNLFHDTVERNIAWGDEEPDFERVVWAAELCGMGKFITDLPDGYSTVIGDRGLRISGGQRQRLSLARAFYRDPRLLILDEATSELDSESEEQIQKTIENARGDITVLVVAHRLSTVMRSDMIHVLGDGKIIESGSPSELVELKSIFYNMRMNDAQ